jgi:hypothetical protein
MGNIFNLSVAYLLISNPFKAGFFGDTPAPPGETPGPLLITIYQDLISYLTVPLLQLVKEPLVGTVYQGRGISTSVREPIPATYLLCGRKTMVEKLPR